MLLAAFRSGADEDELADQPFVLGGDLLGDAAAERKAQQVDLRKASPEDRLADEFVKKSGRRGSGASV